MAVNTKSTNRCSFCGRSQKEVNMLITGPSVNICDECVRMAYEIVESNKKDVDPGSDFHAEGLPKPIEIKQ